jgi:hypothetical protein
MKGKRQPFTRGFYRYCDHWCPECLDRPRCRLHTGATRSRRRKSGPPQGAWEAAVQEATRSFEEAREVLRQTADERAAELLAMSKKDIATASRILSIRHPLMDHGARYLNLCKEMAARLRAAHEEAARDLASRSGFMEVGAQAAAVECLHEAAGVLGRDAATVPVKTRRALEAAYRAKVEAARGSEFASLEEAFVTAAVVLRCLARDEAALRAVYEYDEEFRSLAIDLLACGAGIARRLKRHFPGAAALANVPQHGPAIAKH